MEVMLPSSHDNFNFDSACSSPYAPSTPKRFGEPNFYFSAPSSPTRASALYRDFNNFSFNSSKRGHSSVIPYDWEEKPGTPKHQKPQNEEQNEEEKVVEDEVQEEESIDFEFGFSGQFDKDDTASITDADELFDGGKIKPLKPPPRLQLKSNLSNDFRLQKSNLSSPKSPRSPIAQGKKMIREAFSPKQRRKQVDPFAVAIEQSRKGVVFEERGRERVYSNFSSASRKGSRSLSPYRSPPNFESHQQTTTTSTATTKASNTKSSSRKWSFRDFLLFRSASEGRAADRDPLRKFSLIKRNSDEVKNSSFRSTDSSGSGSGSGSGSMRRGRVSAHEQHYRSNRAVAEEMKRKTVLPYKQGLFGWFRI